MLDPEFNTADYCAEAEECEITLAFCELIDQMINDIKHLEAECVRNRYKLSEQMPSPDDEYYRSDILSGLHSPYQYNLAYQMYIAIYYDGGDPLSFKDWLSTLNNLRKGRDDDRY